MHHDELRATIEAAYEARAELSPKSASAQVRAAVESAIQLLDSGELRVAQKTPAGWQVNEWLKKAVLLSFRIAENAPVQSGGLRFFDKVPLKYGGWNDAQFAAAGVRVVPPATVRRGAFVAPNEVLMPSYVNIGAYVDSGTMVDTWATVGSCAQIGKNVHLSGGVGIGGVLEPLQATPTIIEDGCFIGARSEVTEGVIVGEGAVLSMGVFITSTTRIIDRKTGESHTGHVPPYAVVVPGSRPDPYGQGPSLSCAVIVKTVDARTRSKTSINELLRD